MEVEMAGCRKSEGDAKVAMSGSTRREPDRTTEESWQDGEWEELFVKKALEWSERYEVWWSEDRRPKM